MDMVLNAVEARVLGSLIEKERTTPAYYPMTLNALVAACNQKSNREPLMQLQETDIVRALDGLRDRRLAWEVNSSSTRVTKYSHGARDTLSLTAPQVAILCELLVRGPQTVGELRTHAERMHAFADPAEVATVLAELGGREAGALVAKLPREAGQREERYAHLLSGPVVAPVAAMHTPAEPARLIVSAENERIARLEAEMAVLRDELSRLKAEFADFSAQFK